jgi:hypothetical protein
MLIKAFMTMLHRKKIYRKEGRPLYRPHGNWAALYSIAWRILLPRAAFDGVSYANLRLEGALLAYTEGLESL